MKTLKNDDRGAMTAKMAVGLVVTVTVVGLMAAFLLPVAINEIEGDTTTTLTQDVDTDYDVNAKLVSNVTAATSGTPDSATIELNDTRTAGTTSKTIDVGDNATYSLEGGDVDVGVESINAGTNATANYTYANDYAYGDGASSLWGVLGLAIVLAVFLYIVSVGLTAKDRI